VGDPTDLQGYLAEESTLIAIGFGAFIMVVAYLIGRIVRALTYGDTAKPKAED
jgi:hypothetical protein